MGKIKEKELKELFIEIKNNNKIAFEKLYSKYNKTVYQDWIWLSVFVRCQYISEDTYKDSCQSYHYQKFPCGPSTGRSADGS